MNRTELTALLSPYLDPSKNETIPGEYYHELLESIEGHKYLVNQTLPFMVSYEDALFSWYENVWKPITQEIKDHGLQSLFPQQSMVELFLRVCKHWHFAKESRGRDLSAEEAVLRYGEHFAPNQVSRLAFRLTPRAA